MQKLRVRWHIKPECYYLAAIAILIFPFKWIAAWTFAVAIHECAHFVALRLCGVTVYEIILGASGAIMKTDPMNDGVETICALAGPFGGICLLLFARRMPYAAICAIFQSLYNLLPFYPLDGGRALIGLLRLCVKTDVALRIYRFVSAFFLLAFFTVSVLFLCLGIGVLPLLFTVILLYKVRTENVLANNTNKL